MTPSHKYFVFRVFHMSIQIGLVFLAAFFGPCQGVTLFVNSKYPPPPPFINSLYRAPQTYDRGKSSIAPGPFIIISKVRPCYNLESARHFGLMKPGGHVSTQQGNRLTLLPRPSRPTWVHAESNQLLPDIWTATKAPSLASLSPQEFKGKWQIIQPVSKEELDDRVIKYNKDGTRIVHETLYNYYTRDPQISIKGVPAKGVKVHHDEPKATTAPYAEITTTSTTKTTVAPITLSKIMLTAQYHITSATEQTLGASTGIQIVSTPATSSSTTPTVTTTEMKIAHTLGPIAVASSYIVRDPSKVSNVLTKKPTRTEGQTVNSTLTPVSVVTSYVVLDQPTSTAPPKKSLISKLGGGAQNIFNHIFGGLLNGRHTTDKNGDTLGPGNGTESSQGWAAEETLETVQDTNLHNLSIHHHLSEHITKKLPNSFWSQLQFLKEQLEKSNPKRNVSSVGPNVTTEVATKTSTLPVSPTTDVTAPSTLFLHDEDVASSTPTNNLDFSSTPLDPWLLDQSPQDDQDQESTISTQFPAETNTDLDEEYSDFTSWVASDELATDVSDFPDAMTTLSPMLFGKMNFPTPCPDCANLPKHEEHDDESVATFTSGWRPMRRPVPFLPDPPRAPAPAPMSIHKWLNSAWNDSTDWWANGQEQPMSSSTDFEPESTTEKSISKWFQKVSASNSISRLPSQTPKDFDVTTYRPLSGISPIQWLFGSDSARTNNSVNTTKDAEIYEDEPGDSDIEMRIKEGQEILDLPTSRIKPPKPGLKPSNSSAGRGNSSAQLLKHAQMVNPVGSNNVSHVIKDIHSKNNHSEYRLVPGKHAESSPNKNTFQTFSTAEVIKEMGKFYAKLKVGLGLGLPLPLDIIEPLITMKYESMKAEERLNGERLQNTFANSSTSQ